MSRQSLPEIEVILPIYNEAECIHPLLERFDDVREKLQGKARVRYLFINDGSTDDSRKILGDLHRTRTDVRVVDLIHNFGHGSALACGIDYFNADIAVIMDADLQDPPEAVVDMFEEWRSGKKTVVAERASRKERGRILFNAFYQVLHQMAPSLPKIKFGTHCMLDRSVIDRLRRYSERNRYLPGLVALASGGVHSIALSREARAHGESRVGMLGLVNLAVTAIVSFSSKPVRMVSFLGLVASACAVLFALTIVSIKIFTPLAIPGWASIMTLIAFASGIQLLCLGIIGEYIARIYEETKQRPLYWVDRVLPLAEQNLSAVPSKPMGRPRTAV